MIYIYENEVATDGPGSIEGNSTHSGLPFKIVVLCLNLEFGL